MQPTEIANYLIGKGQHLQSQLDAMCRHVELLSNLEGGALKIGVSPVVEQLFFPDVLLDFIQGSKNVDISFQVEPVDKLLAGVLSGALDVAIGPFASDTLPKEIFVLDAGAAPVVFVVRPGHPVLMGDGVIDLSMLCQFPCIGPMLNQSVNDAFARNGILPELKVTCDNYHISKSVVMNSDYYTGGPEKLFEKELASSELIKVEVREEMYWKAYCIARSESVNAPAVKRFIEILNTYIT